MSQQFSDIHSLLDLLQGLHPISFFHYDGDGNFLDERVTEDFSFRPLFETQVLKSLLRTKKHLLNQRPFFISDQLSLSYTGILFSQEDKEHLLVLGPIFYDSISINHLRDTLSLHNIPMTFRQRLMDEVKKLPVIYMQHFIDFGRMLFQKVLGKIIEAESTLILHAGQFFHEQKDMVDSAFAPEHSSYDAEQKLVRLVAEGNLDYKKELSSISDKILPSIINSGRSLQQARYISISCLVLVSRAAIQGGLSPDTSLTMSSHYSQRIESAKDLSEIREITYMLMDDYVHRVHDIRSNSVISAPIRQCMDYVEFHYADKLTAERIASRVGYASSYLSKKFKDEVGLSLTNYIIQVRMEHAIHLLRQPEISISDICEAVGFNSQSYFGVQFRRYTGTTPGNFRMTGQLPLLES